MSVRPAVGKGSGRNEAEVPTATKDDLDLVRTVFQIVTRQFYQDQHAILIDILSKYLVIPAETLAKALGVSTKEMLQIANQLIRDRLINVFKRSESKESGPSNFIRPSIRSYLYLDSKVFLDVTKWRIMKMRSQIDSVLRNELDNKGYKCPRCGKAFSTLDVAALLDPITMLTFICDVPGCGNELVDNEDAEDVRKSRDRLKRFNEQCGPILDRLRKIDTVALPHFDLMTEVNKKGDSEAWIRRALQRKIPAGSKDVGIATGGAQAGPSIAVDMVSTNPEAEAQRRLEREAEVARMREENALPIWLQDNQDPNVQRLRLQKEQEAAAATRLQDSTQAKNGDVAAVDNDYYAMYASMAQEEKGEDDLDLEEVMGSNGLVSQSLTPQTNGKRSREDSGEEENNNRVKEDDADEDDEDNLDLEAVA